VRLACAQLVEIIIAQAQFAQLTAQFNVDLPDVYLDFAASLSWSKMQAFSDPFPFDMSGWLDWLLPPDEDVIWSARMPLRSASESHPDPSHLAV